MSTIKYKIDPVEHKEKPSLKEMGILTNRLKKNASVESDYLTLKSYIEKGHSVLLAEFLEDKNNIEKDNIRSLSCIALDIDSKEKPVTMDKLEQIIFKKFGVIPIIKYNTFSDVDNTKFRLIYRLEDKVDLETYERLYKALQWKLGAYVDQATFNANRIWAGTNKNCYYIENDVPFNFEIITKLVIAYENKVKREEGKRLKTKLLNKINSQGEYSYNGSYIKNEYKKDAMDLICNSVDLKDFIERATGGSFKKKGKNYVGCCPLHNGDNKGAFVISNGIYTCFTKCGTGNLITVARRYYNIDNFSEVVLKIANDYNLIIPSEYIKEV